MVRKKLFQFYAINCKVFNFAYSKRTERLKGVFMTKAFGESLKHKAFWNFSNFNIYFQKLENSSISFEVFVDGVKNLQKDLILKKKWRRQSKRIKGNDKIFETN